MDQSSLVTQETDAGAELARRLDKFVPVEAAFWVKEGDSGRWYLYIASRQIHESNLDVAYGEVLRLSHQMSDPYLDPFQVKLISASDPLARAAIEIHRRYPAKVATRLGGQNFGGLGVDGVNLYPSPLTTPTP